MAHRNCLYLRVTNDKYELPVAVADTVIELAEMIGLKRRTLESVFCRVRKGETKYKCYKIVEVDDDIDE